MVCFFEGPNLPSSINGAIPTFGVNPSNTNFLAATGSFTNKKDEICTFPKSYTGNKDGENTITPYIMGDFVTRGATARATLPCKGLNGAKTYTSFQCPQVTYNRMAQGTFTMFFVAPTGPEFKPYVFAVSSPTTATDYVYETAISSTTLAPAPATTNFVTQTSGTSTITITLTPEPSTTVTDTVYSATVPTTVFQTLAGRTETVLESSTTTTTFSREGEPSSTITETEYTGTTVITEYSTATIVAASTVTEFVENCSSSAPSITSSSSSSTSTSMSEPSTSTTMSDSTTSSTNPNTESSTSITPSASTDSTATSTFSTTSTTDSSTSTTPSESATLSASTDSTATTTSTNTGTVSSTLTTSSTVSAVPTPPTCPGSDGSSVKSINGAVFTVKCHKDYQAGQLGAVYTESFEACMQSCVKTSGCKAVAFTGGPSAGWCYLKSQNTYAADVDGVWGATLTVEGTGSTETSASSSSASASSTPTTLSCPASDIKSYSAKDGSTYTIECFTDHLAGDISMSYQPSLDSCIESCASIAGCVGIAWIPGSPGPCYLKGEVGAKISNQDVWGAIKDTTAPTPSPTDPSSSDSAAATSTSTPTPTICPKGFLDPSTPVTCPTHNDACIRTSLSTAFQIECHADRYAGDLALSWEPTLAACLETCARTPRCIDVSYAPAARACYMKSALNAITPNRDIHGARLVALPATATTIAVLKRAPRTTLALRPRAKPTDPAGFDYTHPWPFRTSVVTRAAATRVVTVTPAPADGVTATVFAQAVQTTTLSGVATRTVTTEATRVVTETVGGGVVTVTEGVYATVSTTVEGVGVGVGVSTRTVKGEKTETRVVAMTVTEVRTTERVVVTRGCAEPSAEP